MEGPRSNERKNLLFCICDEDWNSNPEITMSEIDQDFNENGLTSTREITWFVRNVRSLPKDAGYALDSPPFVFENATWCLRLYPNGTTIERNADFIGLTIVRLSSRVPHHRLMYLLIVRDGNKGFRYEAADFDEDHKETGDMKLIARQIKRSRLSFPRSSVDVICQVSRYAPPAVDGFSQTKPSMQDTKDVGDLCQNFKSMLLNGQNHDVVLKVKDQEFRAHGDILRARSPALASMLSHDMVEKNSGAICIPDCDPGAFRQFLFYLYGGEVETLDTGNMLSVYYVADKYGVGHLKEVCREFIGESLTCANIFDVIELASNHSDAILLECATQFFVEEMSSVVRTVEWQSFLKRNPIRANELIIRGTDKWCAGKIDI